MTEHGEGYYADWNSKRIHASEVLLSLLEFGLNHLLSGRGMMIFLDKKFEFQISSKKSVSDIRAFPQAGLAGQRQLLASMGVLNARLRAGTQTKVGVLLSCWSCELLFKLYFINKHLPDFLERWSLPCVTFQRTRDRRRPWSPAGIHGVPLGADGSAVSYLHWLRCAWVHCWAEAL